MRSGIHSEIYNIIFMKEDFTETEAQKWVTSFGYRLKKKEKQNHPTQWIYNQIHPRTEFKSFVALTSRDKVRSVFGFRN